MMDKVRWFLSAVAALVMGFLAVLYGKQTYSSLKAKAKAHNARGRVLTKEIETAEREAAVEQDEVLRKAHLDKAEELRRARERVEKLRLRTLQETGDLPASDVDLARRHNDRTRASSVG